jgi:hypothetical protein
MQTSHDGTDPAARNGVTALMPGRLKRMFGMAVMVAFILVYIVIAMDVGNLVVLTKSTTVQMIYFAIAGLAWVPVAGAIVWWTYRKPFRS